MKKYLSLLFAAFVFLGATHLYAFQPGPMRNADPDRPGMRLLKELNLTDDQKKEVQKMFFDLAKQQVAQFSKIATARIELQQLLKADSPDKSAIEKKISDMAQLAVQLHTNRLSQWFAVNKLLNPDQQKVWKRALEMGAARGMGWGGGMDMRGPGRRPMHHPMEGGMNDNDDEDDEN